MAPPARDWHIVETNNGDRHINSKSEFTNFSDYEACLSFWRSDENQRTAGSSRFAERCYYAANTSQFDLFCGFSSEKAEPPSAQQNLRWLALQLTRHFEEAKKAAALAERLRIARDLHDTLAQCLTGIYAQLEAASQIRHQSPDLADACIHKAQELSQRGLQEIRRLVATLQPDATQCGDLTGNLRKLAHECSCEASTKVLFNCKGAIRLVPPDVGHQLVQIAREAVGNALRYAKAQSVRLTLEFTEVNIGLSIEDDGVGFRSDSRAIRKGFGLNTMAQRANRIEAAFSLVSSLGRGTAIRISAPCQAGSRKL